VEAPIVTIRLGGEPQGAGRPRFARASGRAYTPAATRDKGRQRGSPQKASDAEVLTVYESTGSVWSAAKLLGMCGQSVHERLVKLGRNNTLNVFTEADQDRLRRDYEQYAAAGRLEVLGQEMGRTRQFLARQAKQLGLTRPSCSRVWAAGEAGSQRAKAVLARNGHPRGMLGKTKIAAKALTAEEKSLLPWANVTSDDQAARSLKAMRTKVERYGSVAPPNPRGSWKAAWREIGGKRKFFRSRWEANYARYLEWLKQRGVITNWHHEPETFWFEAIKRGVRSYLPDFRVTLPNGKTELHEVKGWMDSRSRTTIARMAKYHPEQKLIVIDKTQYSSIVAKVSRMIEGWE